MRIPRTESGLRGSRTPSISSRFVKKAFGKLAYCLHQDALLDDSCDKIVQQFIKDKPKAALLIGAYVKYGGVTEGNVRRWLREAGAESMPERRRFRFVTALDPTRIAMAALLKRIDESVKA